MTTTRPPAGQLAARFLRTLAVVGREPAAIDGYLAAKGWLDGPQIKAAVAAIGYGDLGTPEGLAVGQSFMSVARQKSVVGRLLAAGLLRTVPDRTRMLEQVSGARASFVPEGYALALSDQTFARHAGLALRAVGGIAVVTEELLATDGAEDALLADLAGAVAAEIDRALVAPASSTGDPAPASILDGAASIPSNGPTADNLRQDLQAMVDAFGGNLETSFWVTGTRVAMSLSLMQRPVGDASIKLGGQSVFFGLPLFTVPVLDGDSNGGYLALIDGSRVQVAGMTTAHLDRAHDATLQMDDNPDNPPDANTVMRSLFQEGLASLTARTAVNWRHGADHAVLLTGVDYRA